MFRLGSAALCYAMRVWVHALKHQPLPRPLSLRALTRTCSASIFCPLGAMHCPCQQLVGFLGASQAAFARQHVGPVLLSLDTQEAKPRGLAYLAPEPAAT